MVPFAIKVVGTFGEAVDGRADAFGGIGVGFFAGVGLVEPLAWVPEVVAVLAFTDGPAKLGRFDASFPFDWSLIIAA